MKYNLMAKAKTNKKMIQASSKARKRVVKRVVQSGDSLDGYAAMHAHMLADPCGADLGPTVYTGDPGYINRFNKARTLGTNPGQTTTLQIYKPGNGLVYYNELAASNSTFTVAYGNDYPGSAFYVANASKVRCGAFCVTISPIASPNNATGRVYFGVVPASSIKTGTINCDDLIRLQVESVAISQIGVQPLEIKWSPGGFDDRYSPVPVGPDDDSDRNVLLIVTTGLPAASGIFVRETAITEWTPTSGLGVVIDSTAAKASRCDKDCVLRALKRTDANWWWSLGKKTFRITKGAIVGYAAGGIPGAVIAAGKFL
nr:MAG: hypothetical protein [Narnaviridae sp.]